MPEMSLRGYSAHKGVSLAAVQKAIKSGRIPVARTQAAGSRMLVFVDSAECDRLWAENTNPVQQRLATRAEMGKGPQTPGSARQNKNDIIPDPIEPHVKPKNAVGEYGELYNKGRAYRENFQAKIAALEYQERSGKLIAKDKVKIAFFNAANTAQQNILNVPARIAPIIAAEYQSRINKVIESIDKGQSISKETLISMLDAVADDRTVNDIMERELKQALNELADGKIKL